MDVLCLCRFAWQITVIFDATVEAAKKFYLQKINVTAPFAETYQTSRLIHFHTIIFSKGWLILCIHMSLGEKNYIILCLNCFHVMIQGIKPNPIIAPCIGISI